MQLGPRPCYLVDQTTDILETPLASTCEVGCRPAEFDAYGNRITSATAKNAETAGVKLLAWTTERSGRIVEDVPPESGGYDPTTSDGLENDGDIMTTIDVCGHATSVRSDCSRTGRRRRPTTPTAWAGNSKRNGRRDDPGALLRIQ